MKTEWICHEAKHLQVACCLDVGPSLSPLSIPILCTNTAGRRHEANTNPYLFISEAPACQLELYTNSQVQALIDGLQDPELDEPCVLQGVNPNRPARKVKEKTPPRQAQPPPDQQQSSTACKCLLWASCTIRVKFVLASCKTNVCGISIRFMLTSYMPRA